MVKTKKASKNKMKGKSTKASKKLTKKSIQTFKKLQCAPNPNKAHKSTCFSHDSLIKLRNYWNARHPDRKIISTNACQIWTTLKHNMGNMCNNEACWLKQQFLREKIDTDLLHYTFAPKSPYTWKSNPNEWLSSVDIENVMKQYEKYYPNFEFIGPSPINYDHHMMYGECVWPELCEFDLDTYLKRNISKIGVVFNLDPHYKGGSHWVALFVDLSKGLICYFDSYAYPPHRQIKKLIKTIEKQGRLNEIEFNIKYNENRHQFGDSECGMYCLFFIINMLKNKSFEYFEKTKIPDDYMLKMRKKFFNGEI